MWRQYLQFTCTEELFSGAVPQRFSSKVWPANMKQSTGGDLYCKFAADLRNKLLEEQLRGTGSLCFITFVLVQVINNTFYRLPFIIYRLEFVDWSKTFLKVFYILWYIFLKYFPNACCNWSTCNIFTLHTNSLQVQFFQQIIILKFSQHQWIVKSWNNCFILLFLKLFAAHSLLET